MGREFGVASSLVNLTVSWCLDVFFWPFRVQEFRLDARRFKTHSKLQTAYAEPLTSTLRHACEPKGKLDPEMPISLYLRHIPYIIVGSLI